MPFASASSSGHYGYVDRRADPWEPLGVSGRPPCEGSQTIEHGLPALRIRLLRQPVEEQVLADKLVQPSLPQAP